MAAVEKTEGATKSGGVRTGQAYIEGLRDGRAVFIDGERVNDVTRHPAFRGTVRSVAKLYDIAADPANRELMTFASPKTGAPVNRFFMMPRSAADMALRRKAIEHWSEQNFGLIGRSPDVGSFVVGMAMMPEIFARGGKQFGENIVRFYERLRDNNQYVTFTVVPPQIDRSKPAHQQADPTLHAGVVGERDDGVIVKGAQMLGTATAIADYVILGALHPIPAGDENYANLFAIPVGAPGVKVYSRRSYAQAVSSRFDYPLSSRFDEIDSILVFDDVLVPWENVFVYRDIELARDAWFATPAHSMGNNQGQIRLSVKLRFLCGLAKRIVEMNGVDAFPAVQQTMGELSSWSSMIDGMVLAQEANCRMENRYATPGRAEHYAVMALQSVIYPTRMGLIRELAGGGLIQLPSSVADFDNPEIAADIERYVQSPGFTAKERVALMKLAWDMIGSEFAGRHHQYELFHAGAPFIVKGHSYRAYDFDRARALVADALALQAEDDPTD